MNDTEACGAETLDVFETREYSCALPYGHSEPWHTDEEGHTWRDAPLYISVE